MYLLSKKRTTAKPKRLAYVHKIAELSRRGDIDAVAELMKGYFSNKKSLPWDRMYKDIETYWNRENSKISATETLILLRDAIFGALDILSLSIALNISTSDLLSLFVKEKTWKEGRRSVRNRCIELVEGLLKKKKTRLLVPSALKRDGFGFLIDEVEEVEMALFKKAKPELKKAGKKKKVLDLAPLQKVRMGCKFLREQMVMENELPGNDPRIAPLLEAYDNFLVEYEIDRRSAIPEEIETEQVTLNGKPVSEEVDEKTIRSKRKTVKDVQSPLTDFIEEKKSMKPPRKGSSKKKGGRKKK
ncbi:MAG: hypothetical protein ACFFF9_09800 [Candidatus Thorarchaeota archaeon]